MMKSKKGLILVELIAVIVLVGIIASFTTFFLYTGVKGYINTKDRTEAAFSAQMALDRISQELRDLDYFASPLVPNSSLTYTNEVLSGTRKLSFDSNNNRILLGIGSNSYILLMKVSTFTLTALPMDLNDDGNADEVGYIEVGFSMNGINREFKTRIFPRYMVKNW